MGNYLSPVIILQIQKESSYHASVYLLLNAKYGIFLMYFVLVPQSLPTDTLFLL